jgi:hypothetical protein
MKLKTEELDIWKLSQKQIKNKEYFDQSNIVGMLCKKITNTIIIYCYLLCDFTHSEYNDSLYSYKLVFT